MSIDPFPTIYSEDLDEDVRPHRHVAGQRPYVGTYEVTVRFATTVLTPSKPAARALVEARLTGGADIDESTVTASEPTYELSSVEPGEVERARAGDFLRDCRAYVWFAGFQSRTEGELHAAMQSLTSALFAQLEQSAPAAPPAIDPPTDTAPVRKLRLRAYEVEFALTFTCARTVWAVDDDDALGVLDEDVNDLLYHDSIDLWTDDQTAVAFAITGVERLPKPKGDA